MKNRIVKKILRIILLTIVGAAVIGTFYFLWKKAQPVITVYEVVTPKRDTERSNRRMEEERTGRRPPFRYINRHNL